MKKFVLFSAFAAALIAFSSCSKESESPVSFTPGQKVTINFSTGNAVQTKSAITEEGATEATYEWTNEDAYNFKLYLVDGGSLTEVTEKTVTRTSGTVLAVSATVDAAASYTFRAIIARDFKAAGQPKVITSQSPSTTDYDPSADVLVSADLVVTDVDATNTLQFSRKAVINKMTLTDLTEGEKINRIEITSDVNLTGYYDGNAMVGDGKKIILNYADAAVPASGEFPVYFTTIPNSGHTLSVEVTTNQNTYTKSSFGAAGINFIQGQMTRFTVALPAGTPATTIWTRMTNATTLNAGDQIVITNVSYEKSLSTTQNGNNRAAANVSSSDEGATITIGADTEVITLEGSTDEWYLKVTGGYLYASSSSGNQLKTSNKGTATTSSHGIWTISANSSGVASVTANCTDNRHVMQYNPNSGNPIFSCYASASQTQLSVYKASTNSAKYPTVWNLSSIRVAQLPTKTEYNAGETFSTSGLVVMGLYEDASDADNTKEEVISNGSLTISPSTSTPLEVANTSVSISYGGKNTSVAIVVNKATPTLSVSPATLSVQKGKTLSMTVTGSDGDMTCTSANTSIATVTDAGVITGVAKGSTTITINTAATVNYFAGSTTVEVTVTEDETVTITTSNLTTLSGTVGGVTVTISNGLVNGTQRRVYKSQTMEITAPSGKAISKIVITCTAEGANQYGPGCFVVDTGSYTYASYDGTWTGNASSVTFTASTNQVRITNMIVTLVADGS